MKTIKTYKVSTKFSSREIQARSKKEALDIFKKDKGTFYTEDDKITIK